MASQTPDRLSFNTDALSERDRFPAFCEGMFRHVVGADIEQLGTAPFRGTLDISRAGTIAIAEISVTPATMSRHGGYLRDGNDDIVVQLWRHGLADTFQGEHENRIVSGNGLVIDNTSPARISVQAASRFWALIIPRDSIVTGSSDVSGLAGAKLADSLGLRLLSPYLEEIKSNALVDQPTALLFANHIIDLVALALGTGPGEAAEPPGVRAARRAAILREIEGRKSDLELSAATVARRLGITPRYVHLLLEETGRSFTHHVLEKRLDKAAALLRSPLWRTRKIAEIAAQAGFNDLSYFNRAFRRRFGATPSDLREAARSESGHSG